jgi:hypothetical protein
LLKLSPENRLIASLPDKTRQCFCWVNVLANAKFAYVTRDRAIAGSERSFQTSNICDKPPSMAAVFCPPGRPPRKYVPPKKTWCPQDRSISPS